MGSRPDGRQIGDASPPWGSRAAACQPSTAQPTPPAGQSLRGPSRRHRPRFPAIATATPNGNARFSAPRALMRPDAAPARLLPPELVLSGPSQLPWPHSGRAAWHRAARKPGNSSPRQTRHNRFHWCHVYSELFESRHQMENASSQHRISSWTRLGVPGGAVESIKLREWPGLAALVPV